MSDGLTRLLPDPPPSSYAPTDLVDPDELLSGAPNDRGVTGFASEDGRVESGVWACDTYSERLASYPADELYVILEGSLVVTVDGEGPERFEPGDALVIRRGTACTLEFQAPFRKFFMTYDPTAPADAG